MAMNLRLLRPRASSGLIGGLDADARTYITAVRNADGQFMEPAVQTAINAFITGCKSDGTWTAIKASCILMGARTLSGALTPLVGSAPTNNNFVSGDYNRKTGLVGNGSTKYLNSNRANNADPQDNVHHSFYVSEVTPAVATAQSFMGYGGAITGSTMFVRSATPDGTVFVRNRSAATDPPGAGFAANAGFWAHRRDASSQFFVRANGVSFSYNRTSENPGSQPVFVFGRSSGTGTIELPSPFRFAFYSIGESLSLTLLDTRVSTLYTAIGAAIP